MKNYIVDNPLRTISFVIENNGPLSSIEDEALHKYTALHDFVFSLLQQYEQWRSKGVDYKHQLQKRADEITDFEKQMEECNRLMRLVMKYEEPPTGEKIECKINPGQLFIDANSFQEEFNVLYESLKEWVQEFETLEDLYEQYGALFEEFHNNYFMVINDNWKFMKIDLCSLDDDFNCFKEKLPAIDNMRDVSIDERDVVVQEYELLLKRVNKFYNEVSSFSRFFKSFQQMNEQGNKSAEWN
ncbi:MAG: hypothetical protein ACTHOF_15070 [Flavisolibacter sp.]|jgi:hypothetical protein